MVEKLDVLYSWGCSRSHTFKMERLFAFRCTQIFKIFFEYFLFFFDINSFIHLQHKQKLRISIYELGIATEVLSIIQWFYLVLCQLNFWSCTNRLDKGQNFGELQCLKTMWLVEVTEQVWVIYLKRFILYPISVSRNFWCGTFKLEQGRN